MHLSEWEEKWSQGHSHEEKEQEVHVHYDKPLDQGVIC